MPLQHQGSLVQRGPGHILNNAVRLDIAEPGDLVKHALIRNGLIAAQHDDIRRDTEALELLYRVLGGLGLVLPGGPQIGHQRHVDIEGIVLTHFPAHLPDSLQEGLALHIAGGAADLRDDYVRLGLLAHGVNKALDLIGDMGDGLDGLPQVLAPALLGDDVGIDPACGKVGELIEILVNEALIMTQIQIRLRPVLGDEDLTVLIGAHGARIHIDIGIQLLGGHLQPPGFEQAAQRGCRDALAKA